MPGWAGQPECKTITFIRLQYNKGLIRYVTVALGLLSTYNYLDPHPLLVLTNFILSISLYAIAIISQQIYHIQEIVNSFELSVLKLQIVLRKIFVLRQ